MATLGTSLPRLRRILFYTRFASLFLENDAQFPGPTTTHASSNSNMSVHKCAEFACAHFRNKNEHLCLHAILRVTSRKKVEAPPFSLAYWRAPFTKRERDAGEGRRRGLKWLILPSPATTLNGSGRGFQLFSQGEHKYSWIMPSHCSPPQVAMVRLEHLTEAAVEMIDFRSLFLLQKVFRCRILWYAAPC